MLGSVAVATEDGELLPLGPVKRRSLLAMLLLHPNQPVTLDRLTEALWDTEPPTHSRTVLQGHVSQLRALLAARGARTYGIELATLESAYVLRLPETLVDAHRFEELVQLARGRRSPGDAVLLLREALALWQGPALTDTVASPPLEAPAHALEELRLSAVEALAAAYGELGEHGKAAAVLRTEAVAHPLREPLSAALMLALARSGQRSDALDWFQRTRRLLADELGVDPGPQLTDAYTTVLDIGAPDAVESPAVPEPEPVAAVPDMLPRRPRGFAGRLAELTALTRVATGPHSPIALVTGGAGVGKTALAVHWAYEHAAAFPDGRLFADLCGYSDTPTPQTTVVLHEFLLALGVPVRRIPDTEAGMGSLYRSLTAGRRILVVLDNARNSDQIRPLLPGGDDSATLVTSRDRLGGLIASDAARPVRLGELPADDCAALLGAVLGEDRVVAEPDAARRLAALCDGLPLALRITAARLTTRPRATLAALATELADEQRRLGLMNIEDTGVAAALGLTVHQLPEHARRMFHSLGLHTGPRLDRYAAAALADCTPDHAWSALDRLADAHLIVDSGLPSDAYTLHDLVRLYARTLAPQADPGALTRLLDHYLHTGLIATATAEPSSQPCFTLPATYRRPPAVREFENRQDALSWFEAERATLLGAATAAAAAQLHDRVWRLVLLQWPLIVWRVRDGWVPLLEQALESAELDHDLDAQSRTRALLGWVLHEEERYEEALEHLRAAPELAHRAGDLTSEAIARINLALALAAYDEHEQALELVTHALDLARRGRDRSTEMLAHQHLARHFLRTGAPQQALEHASLGLELGPSLDAAPRRVLLRTAYGEALAGLGRAEEARRQLTEALHEAKTHGFEEGATAAEAALAELD
ncbi:BTAD domain-containing putative transcriptional regulator [Streptomyces sp. CBMA152]|uniref:AfsR/SARP family transcriptional regulator n=1 Tax=Streptomyces sp. CBMA152 TaxID=1896312 RepID=UPI002948BD56|nr:BTAD domain-containing putative transcriptional regulator [Streptomyces sp. CBMA152]